MIVAHVQRIISVPARCPFHSSSPASVQRSSLSSSTPFTPDLIGAPHASGLRHAMSASSSHHSAQALIMRVHQPSSSRSPLFTQQPSFAQTQTAAPSTAHSRSAQSSTSSRSPSFSHHQFNNTAHQLVITVPTPTPKQSSSSAQISPSTPPERAPDAKACLVRPTSLHQCSSAVLMRFIRYI